MNTELHPDNPSNWNAVPKGDLGASFEKIKSYILPIFHKGYRIEKEVGGFSFRGKTYKTLSEIESEIDRILDQTEKEFPETKLNKP